MTGNPLKDTANEDYGTVFCPFGLDPKLLLYKWKDSAFTEGWLSLWLGHMLYTHSVPFLMITQNKTTVEGVLPQVQDPNHRAEP